MRNLIKKSLAFVLVAALALTCFVGTFSVSAEDATSYNANISVTANPVTLGDTEATAVIDIDMVEENVGINEALINISSEIGAIKDVKLTASDVAGEIDYGTGEDVVPADCKGFYLSANSEKVDGESVMGSIASATITVTFAVADTVKAGTYAITIDIPESKVIAATKDEVAVNFIYDNSVSFVVEEAVTECEHVNATKTLSSVTETEFVYTLDCPDCDEENLTDEVAVASYTSDTQMKASIQPKNSIGIRFFMMDSDMRGYTDFTLVATKEYYLKNDATVRYQDYYQTNYFECNNNEYSDRHEFVFENVSAYEMNNNVDAKIFGKNSEGEMVCLYERSISVAYYVKAVMPKSNSAFAKTLVDLVVYGSKMQTYCGQNTDNLVDSFLSDTQRSWGTPESDYPTSSSGFNSLTTAQTTVQYLDTTTPLKSLELRRSLSAGSRINLYFTLRSITLNSMDLSNVYCKYEYYADKNTKTDFIEAYNDKAAVHNATYHAFLFDIAPASMLDYPVKATIYYGHPDDSNSIAVSSIMSNAESYIAALVGAGQSGKMIDALKAMWAFGHSLADYAGVPAYVVQ